MSKVGEIEESFLEWIGAREVPEESPTAEMLEAADWPNSSTVAEPPPFLRWVFAAKIYHRDGKLQASGKHYAKALWLLDRTAPLGVGFGVLRGACAATGKKLDEVVAAASAEEELATICTQLLKAHEEHLPVNPDWKNEADDDVSDAEEGDTAASCRDRPMHSAYDAVATFQTCLLYLHSKQPDLLLPDLHNLCYFADAVYYERYGESLFGAPRVAKTGVMYEEPLSGTLEGILDRIMEAFKEKQPAEITQLVLADAPCAGRREGEPVYFTCMPAECLRINKIIASISKSTYSRLDRTGFGDSVPIDGRLTFVSKALDDPDSAIAPQTTATATPAVSQQIKELNMRVAELQAQLQDLTQKVVSHEGSRPQARPCALGPSELFNRAS